MMNKPNVLLLESHSLGLQQKLGRSVFVRDYRRLSNHLDASKNSKPATCNPKLGARRLILGAELSDLKI